MSEVEFLLAIDAERTLNVLLNDLLLLLRLVFHDFFEVTSAVDAETASVVRWFDNPNVVSAIYLSVLG